MCSAPVLRTLITRSFPCLLAVVLLGSRLGAGPSGQAVAALDFTRRYPAKAVMRPAPAGVGANHCNFIRQWTIVQRDSDPVIMGTHVKRVLVRKRHVDRGARRRPLGERRDPGLAAIGGL